MVITKTPFRMSFFGGGTDIESFFHKNGGAVLSTTFDKYCYVNVRYLPNFLIIRRSFPTQKLRESPTLKTYSIPLSGMQ